jgi:ferritin-like metal-binding protein YciE
VVNVGIDRDQLAAWLDDAYAMESGLVTILQNHAAHLDPVMPSAAQRLREHIAETRTHATRLEQCLAALGRKPSTIKSTISSAIGAVEGASTALFKDHVIKDVLADYASEQFEVACYTAMMAAATRLGFSEITRLCALNLAEDQAMATWLIDKVPTVIARAAAMPAQPRQ